MKHSEGLVFQRGGANDPACAWHFKFPPLPRQRDYFSIQGRIFSKEQPRDTRDPDKKDTSSWSLTIHETRFLKKTKNKPRASNASTQGYTWISFKMILEVKD